MSDVLTVEELSEIREQNFDALLQAQENECFPGMLQGEQLQIQRLLTTIEALQAKNKRLVEALGPIVEHIQALESTHPIVKEWLPKAERALSTLPAEALEAERRREEVIRAAKALDKIQAEFPDYIEAWGPYLDALSDKLTALEALEGGK